MERKKREDGKETQLEEDILAGGESDLTNHGMIAPTSSSCIIVDPISFPIKILPEEIWVWILHNIEDAKSVQNMFLAYPPFRTTFKKKVPTWLFEQIFPHLLAHLSMKEVRRCSHVCRTWRRVVFKYAEDRPPIRLYDDKQPDTDNATFSSNDTLEKFVLEFRTNPHMDRFITINPSNLNPFIGRSVHLAFAGRKEDFQLFSNRANLLLDQCGHHIWFFKIYVYICEAPDSNELLETINQFYQLLQQILSRLANLRSLDIYFGQPPTFPTPNERNLTLDTSVFPPLPHLQSLAWDWVDGIPERIFRCLLRSYVNGQLRYLALPSDIWNGKVLLECDSNPGINLKGLTHLKIFGQDFELNLANLMDQLSKEGMQKMEFDHYYHPDKFFFTCLYGFQISVLHLEHSPLSLKTYCTKECNRLGNCTTWTDYHVSLPSLRTLRMKHEMGNSYKFLSKIPSLEYLEIWPDTRDLYSLHDVMSQNEVYKLEYTCGCHHDEITKELYGWMYQERTLNKSRIWNFLPALHTLKIWIELQSAEIGNNSVRSIVRTHQRKRFVT